MMKTNIHDHLWLRYNFVLNGIFYVVYDVMDNINFS